MDNFYGDLVVYCSGFDVPIFKKMRKSSWGMLLTGFVTCNLTCGYISDVFKVILPKLIERMFIPYAIWFFIGVFCYVYRNDIVPKLKKIIVPL